MNSQFEEIDKKEDENNSLDAFSVTLNGFMFCTRHGLEVCERCPTDNRSYNNGMVDEMLHERLTEEEYKTKWKGDDREPLSVSHKWVKVNKTDPGCVAHKTVACKECFNWGEQLYRGIHGGRKPRVSRLQRKGKDRNQDRLT
jgi:hypothetical protein